MALDLHYLAGVIDARGHLSTTNRHGKMQPKISVTTRKTPLLHYLSRHTGVGVTLDNREYERKPCTAHCTTSHSHTARQSSYWTVGSARATIVLFGLEPLLDCQKEEASLILSIGLKGFNPSPAVLKEMRELGWKIPAKKHWNTVTM